LVVVADHEDPVRRRGEQQCQTELGAVDVLNLVDQELGTAPAPPSSTRSATSTGPFAVEASIT